MRGAWRQATATLVLGPAAFFWLSIPLIALHLETHGAHQHEHAALAAVLLHGHAHEAGTPDHEHRLTLSPAAPLPTKQVLRQPLFHLARIVMVTAPLSSGISAVVSGLGHDPPLEARSVTILRI